MLFLDTYSYSMILISPPRRTKSLRSLGGSSVYLLNERTPANTSSANHSTFSVRKSLWNDLDYVPDRVKLRSTCSSYRKSFKIYQSGASSYPRKHFTQLQTFHLPLPMLMINTRKTFTFRQSCDRRLTTKTITPRVAQPTSTLTTRPSLHHVKEGRDKDALRHELVRQLFARNSSVEGNPWKGSAKCKPFRRKLRNGHVKTTC